MNPPSPPPFPKLRELLEKRLALIADHAWRDRDPASHLEALAGISGEVEAWRREHTTLPARLRHFLDQASYQKALEYLKASETGDS